MIVSLIWLLCKGPLLNKVPNGHSWNCCNSPFWWPSPFNKTNVYGWQCKTSQITCSDWMFASKCDFNTSVACSQSWFESSWTFVGHSGPENSWNHSSSADTNWTWSCIASGMTANPSAADTTPGPGYEAASWRYHCSSRRLHKILTQRYWN